MIEWQGTDPSVLDPSLVKKKKATQAETGEPDEVPVPQLQPYVAKEEREVRVMAYDMSDFMKACVVAYATLTDTDPTVSFSAHDRDGSTTLTCVTYDDPWQSCPTHDGHGFSTVTCDCAGMTATDP